MSGNRTMDQPGEIRLITLIFSQPSMKIQFPSRKATLSRLTTTSLAGTVGFDYLGFADQSTQDDLSIDAGAFLFSRPEDLSTNPNNRFQAVFHSTGRSELYNQTELWGHTFQVDVNFDLFEPGQPIPADITVLYDGNVLGDNGIRSPDNGVWATDGIVYGACNIFSSAPNIKCVLFTVLC
jgi:hypothetical protein